MKRRLEQFSWQFIEMKTQNIKKMFLNTLCKHRVCNQFKHIVGPISQLS